MSASYKLIKIEDYRCKEKDSEIAKLLPTVVFPFRATFELHGVNTAIANAVRRVILSEYPTKVLTFNFDKFSTNDPYTLHDFVLQRVRNLPLMQTCPDDAVFKLSFKNTTPMRCDVKSSNIVDAKTGAPIKYMNGNFTVCSIEPGNEINISFYVMSGYSYTGGGWFCVASSATSIPIISAKDSPMYDGFDVSTPQDDKALNSTSVTNYDKFTLTYIGCGTVPHNTIYKTTIEQIVARLKNVEQFIDTGSYVDKVFTLEIQKETHTIKYLLETEILRLYPDIKGVVAFQDDMTKTVYIKIKDDKEKAKDKVRAAIASLVTIYGKLK